MRKLFAFLAVASLNTALLAAHLFKISFPALTVWRIRQHEIELPRAEAVLGKRVRRRCSFRC